MKLPVRWRIRLGAYAPRLSTELRQRETVKHFPMVAGIVLAAFGLEETLAHVDDSLHSVPAFALLGRTSIYLLAHVTLRLRNARTINRQRLALALLLLVLWPAAGEVSALVTLAVVNVLIWLMIAYEMTTYDERRYALRHGLDFEPPHR